MLYKLPLYLVRFLLLMIYNAGSTVYQKLIGNGPSNDAADERMQAAANFTIGGPGKGLPATVVSRIPGTPGDSVQAALNSAAQWEPREIYVHKDLLEMELQASKAGLFNPVKGVQYHYWMFIDKDAMHKLPENERGGPKVNDCLAAWALTKTSRGDTPLRVRDQIKYLSEVELAHFQVNPAKRHLRFGMAAVEAIHQFDAGQTRTTLECLKSVVPFYKACEFVKPKEDMGQIPSLAKYQWLVRDRKPTDIQGLAFL